MRLAAANALWYDPMAEVISWRRRSVRADFT
jgi:hypothetical protein